MPGEKKATIYKIRDSAIFYISIYIGKLPQKTFVYSYKGIAVNVYHWLALLGVVCQQSWTRYNPTFKMLEVGNAHTCKTLTVYLTLQCTYSQYGHHTIVKSITTFILT